MPSALELRDLVAPGGGPRDPQRGESRLSPAVDEQDRVRAGYVFTQPARQGLLAFRGGAEEDATRKLLPQGLLDRGMGVPQDHRPEADVAVDVTDAVDVGHVRALPLAM